jgi:glyoxylase-like metal-dependent hydrolase (beta-lactamase superfamily II)
MADSTTPISHRTATDYPAELAPGLFLLGNRYFSFYLVRGERAAALVEMGVSAMVPTVVAQLDALRIAPDFLVVTHPHADHLTGLPGLATRFPKARVLAGAGAATFANHPAVAAGRAVEDAHMTRFLVERGLAEAPSALPLPGDWRPDQEVAKGAALDLGSVQLRFRRHQGHSPGNVIVEIPERRVLLASDSLGYAYDDGHFFPVFFTGFQSYLANLVDFEAGGFRVLGLGHNGAATGEGVLHALRTAQSDARIMHDRIATELASGSTTGEIVENLFTDYYRDALRLYTPENIRECCRLLVKRSAEASGMNRRA